MPNRLRLACNVPLGASGVCAGRRLSNQPVSHKARTLNPIAEARTIELRASHMISLLDQRFRTQLTTVKNVPTFAEPFLLHGGSVRLGKVIASEQIAALEQ
jgi:hypothetical protein